MATDAQSKVRAEGFPPGIAGEVSGEGTLAIWCHGLSSSRAIEDAVDLNGFTRLSGYRVARFDAPGHGASSDVTDDKTTTWPRMGSLMLDIGAGLGDGPFIAGGASMGTAASLWAAVTDPSALAALVLVIPPTAWETRAAQRDIHLANADIVAEQGMAAYLDAADKRPLVEALESVALVQRAVSRAALAGVDAVSFAHALRGAAASDFPSRERVASLEIPTLIFSWAGDPQHPMRTGEELAELIRGSEFHPATRLGEIREWRAIAAEWLDAHV